MCSDGNYVLYDLKYKLFQTQGRNLCTAHPLSYIDIVFSNWRSLANPQSGELLDYSDQIYELLL